MPRTKTDVPSGVSTVTRLLQGTQVEKRGRDTRRQTIEIDRKTAKRPPSLDVRTESDPLVGEREVGRAWLRKGKARSKKASAPRWWKEAVTYQILVRSFADSNGDGIGDLEGVRKKLDYLSWLGVDCIWLNPFLQSPLKDDGYDMADYFSVLPEYGDMEALKALIEEAHERGIKIIMDVALNHTSDQHPWFKRAVAAPKGSSPRDWYVWTDDPDKYNEAGIVFVDAEESNWSWNEKAGAFYWHRFYAHQPDLNYENEEVQKAILEVFDFWVDQGIDGFRLDAIPYLFEEEGTNCENLGGTHDFVKRLRKRLDERTPDRSIALLAEANQPREDVIRYFGEGDECNMAYDFNTMPQIFAAVAAGSARGFEGVSLGLVRVLEDRPELMAECVLAAFLRCHDELTLGMVSEGERRMMYEAYAKDPKAKRHVGIGRRLMPLLMEVSKDREAALAKNRLLHSLLFALDSPFMFYGDEIGMGDNLAYPDRHPVRTAMQWSKGENGGFSDAPEEALQVGKVVDPGFTSEEVNVEDQMKDPDSLLNFVRKVIHVRKAHAEMATGKLEVVDPDNRDVLAFTKGLRGKKTLCLFNFSDEPMKVAIDAAELNAKGLENLLDPDRPVPKPDDDGSIRMTMEPNQALWLGVKRSAVKQDQPGGRRRKPNAPQPSAG